MFQGNSLKREYRNCLYRTKSREALRNSWSDLRRFSCNFHAKIHVQSYIIEHVFQFYLLIPIQFFAREYINQSRITSLLHQIETSFHDELNTTFLLYVLLNLGRLVMEELRGGWWRTRHFSRSLIYFSHINYISITKKVWLLICLFLWIRIIWNKEISQIWNIYGPIVYCYKNRLYDILRNMH